ncbi:hypothetical protein [Aquella oligotrophica]|uniref:Choice-of-anchor D domain-containing protein n=1 Tax=Aquella oligotrophica TaxID=2067065 RepID=A0A2I7N5Q8_9NEIS|nr:hypothetical protein [Aquella oligotrophica]AUR51780.1 hypothetical protein CUN60_05555 [Aquella oligotrophica]
MKNTKLNIVLLSALLAACNGGGTSTGASPANNNALSFSTNSMQMLTGGKVRTVELQAKNIDSNVTVDLQTSNSNIHLNSNICIFSPANHKCEITIVSGENEGNYTVTAKTSNGETSKPLNVNIYKMGAIEADSNSLILKPKSTNTVDISLKNIDGNYPSHKLVFKAPQELVLDKSECIISGSQPHCKLAVTSLNQEGNYIISYQTVNTATNKSISGYSAAPIKVSVSNNDAPTPTPGFKPQIEFSNSSINMVNGETTEATLKLVNYASADKSYNVDFLAPNNVTIINQSDCELNNDHSTCTVQFEAKQSGDTQLKAFSDGLTIAPANVHVHPPGVVMFNNNATPFEWLSGGDRFNHVRLKLEPNSPYDQVTVNLDPEHLMELSTNTCTLSNENKECDIVIKNPLSVRQLL